MGKAKRFNTYDSAVADKRKLVEGFGQQRQNRSIGSSFRTPPQSPPIATITAPIPQTPGSPGGVSFPIAYPVDDHGSVSGTVIHSLTATTAHKLQFTATGDCDITITGFGSSNTNAVDFYIEVTQDNTGGWAVTFNDAEVIAPPTLSTTADTVSLLACHADGDGNIRIVTLLNASPGAGGGANTSLSNLTSPVLNVSVDVNTKNLTNIDEATFTASGGTTAAEYGIAVNAPDTKLLFNVPTGKEYDFLVNNVAVWNMSSTSLTGANLILSNTLVLNDSSADPLASGIFTQNGTDVKVFSGGSVRNFSDIGIGGVQDKILEGDSSVEVVDTGLGSIAFVADTVAQGTITDALGWVIDNNVNITSLNTLTVGGIALFNSTTTFQSDVNLGNDTGDTISVTGRIDSNVNPDADGTRTLGSSSLHWDDVFTESLTLKGLGGTTANTVPHITADATTMSFNVPTGDGWVFQDNGITDIQITEDSASTDYMIRAGASKKLAFVTSSANVAIGSVGTIVAPISSTATVDKAVLDGLYGDEPGSMGFHDGGSGNLSLWLRQADGNWALVNLVRDQGT